jgi:glycosyltransferase involved in cell wall biosynthesis
VLCSADLGFVVTQIWDRRKIVEVLILGTRGIPAEHGGFETFAEDFALYLVREGHAVSVYCQVEEKGPRTEDIWNGIHRIMIPARAGALGTMSFDWQSVWDSTGRPGIILTLGYNTAILTFLYRIRGRLCIMNMDGIEWKRKKWSLAQRAWLWFNERCGAALAHHLVADHPKIAEHLQRHTSSSKITTIPYGADILHNVDPSLLDRYSLKAKSYYLLIARAEPENSILEVVQSYSRRRRKFPLVILGAYSERNPYHRKVLESATEDVRFVGAIYDKTTVQALRYHARAYVHGHKVGGTNPSLVEALAAGNAVIAHDNHFNRWVTGPHAAFFQDVDGAARIFDSLDNDISLLASMEAASRKQHAELFTQQHVLPAYEQLLKRVERASRHLASYVSVERWPS